MKTVFNLSLKKSATSYFHNLLRFNNFPCAPEKEYYVFPRDTTGFLSLSKYVKDELSKSTTVYFSANEHVDLSGEDKKFLNSLVDMEDLHKDLVGLLRKKQFFNAFECSIDRFINLRNNYSSSEKFFVSDPNFLYDLLSFLNVMQDSEKEKSIALIRNQDWEFVAIAREPVDTAVSLMKQYIKDRSGWSGIIEINKELILFVRDKSQLFRFLDYFTSIVKKKLEIVEQKFMISKPEKFLMLIGSEFNVCPNMPKIDLKNPNPGLVFLPMLKEN